MAKILLFIITESYVQHVLFVRKALAEKELGNAAYKKKDFETALTHYGNAIELDPYDITYRNNRAGEFKEKG